jgi:hypothetical protein
MTLTRGPTFYERMKTTLVHKFAEFNIFPTKLFLHFLLLLLTCLQVILVISNTAAYNNSQITMWNKLFCDIDADNDE